MVSGVGCRNRTLATVGQRLCGTCSNPANKLALRNSDFPDNVGVCSSLKSCLRENTFERGNTFENNLKELKKATLYGYNSLNTL